MAHYLDPKNDLIFRRIFGEHEHLCMSLLNSILPLDASQQIVALEYQQPELVPEIPGLKDSIVDVHCKDNFGRQFIVEMQMYWTDSFRSRVLFNASKAYVRQLDAGKEYKLLQPVYALSFVNEPFDRDPSVYYHHYKIVNIENREKRIEGLEFVFIELPKFRPTNRAEKKLYDLWLTFLTQINEGEEEVPPVLFEEGVTKEALHHLERYSYSRGELDTYDRYWDVIRKERMYYLDALDKGLAEGEAIGTKKGREKGLAEGEAIGTKKGREKGLAEGEAIGIEKGREKGLAEGEAIGIEKGRAEGKAIGIEKGRAEELRNVVLNAKRSGLSIVQIQTITSGLSEEEVNKIIHSGE
ncbi:MAG: Rpn family recombination-promoting nuclease/putative transposase [Prevotellaceae bacterium]|jgi:predicted transposase/invertase (TIGR01784 family)|nr:Rpn family recombination-promoting nuclease/putative transposase [Prevotellaceae bacterium]